MTIDRVLLSGASSLQEVKQWLDDALTGVGAHEQAPLTFTDLPPDRTLDENPDIAFTASGVGPVGGWAARIYIWDRGDSREVRLRALGDTWARTLWNGARGRQQLARSRRVVDRLVLALRTLDAEQP